MEYLKKTFTSQYFFVLLALITGISLSVFAGWLKHEALEEKQLHDFHQEARDRIEVIKDAIQNHVSVVTSVASLYNSSDFVSREEFRIFTSQLLEDNPYIQAIEWIPVVPAPERAKFEKEVSDFMPGYQFKDSDGKGGYVRAPEREIYYPITYIEPFERNNDVMGVESSNRPIAMEAFTKAMETGQTTATAKVKLLLKEYENKTGVAVFAPVYKSKHGKASAEDKPYGFVGTVAPLEKLVDAAIHPLSPAGLHVLIHDLSSADGKDDPLYVFCSRLLHLSPKKIIDEYMYDKDHAVEKAQIDFQGRRWEITVISAKGYYKVNGYAASLLPTLIGTIFTIMICVYLLNRINEAVRITKEVNERTEILNRTKKEIELILHSSQDAIIGIDSEGNINLSNPKALNLLGYSRRDLIGKHHAVIQFTESELAFYDAATSTIGRTLKEGIPSSSYEENFWKRDGSSIQVEYNVAPLIDDGMIKGAVMVFRDITERKKQMKQLEQLASYDHLTGVANRALFIELLKKSVARASRTKTKVAVLYLDLNDFKPINDNYGHRMGDLLLKGFTERVRGSLRLYDTLARMGGDEFIILAENIQGRADCEVLIERLHTLMKTPFVIEGNEFVVSSSVGVSIFPDDATDLDSLISHADSAMYLCKRERSSFRFYQDIPV